MSTSVTAPSSGWNYHVVGPIVAIKSSTEFLINGGKGVGYLDVYLTSSTVKDYNGLSLKAGEYADVYGNGSESTYVKATQVSLSTSSNFTASSGNFHVAGPIVAIKSSSEFEINGGTGVGYLDVYLTSSTVKNYNGLTPKVGYYANVYGNGSESTYVTATQVTLTTSATTTTTSTASVSYNMHVDGPIVAIKSSSEFEINGGSGVGYLNVYLTSSTVKNYNGLTPKVGYYANVYGNGSVSTYVTATQVTLSTSSTSTSSGTSSGSTATTTSSTVPKHILTADYLQGYYGTYKVTPSTAARYLSWAQTNPSNANAIASAGIKTQVYVDDVGMASTDPMWSYVSGTSSAYSYTCSGSKVREYIGSTEQYIFNPSSSAVRSAFQKYTSALKGQAHIDMIWEDGSQLPIGASYPTGMPCSFSSSGWASAVAGMNQYSSIPIIENGLNLWTSGSLSPTVATVTGSSNTIGGNMEHCFTDNIRTIQYGTAFIQVENTALDMTNHGKYFECMARNTQSAASQIPARLFTLASFLLTYDINRSVLQEEFYTPSGLHVMPETQLVPTDPAVGEPSNVSALRTSTGVYARKYNACYLAGVDKGACVVAVNNGSTSERFPYSGYYHTLAISGYGVLDGGTVSTSGGAPPTYLSPGQAVIAFK